MPRTKIDRFRKAVMVKLWKDFKWPRDLAAARVKELRELIDEKYYDGVDYWLVAKDINRMSGVKELLRTSEKVMRILDES